MLVSMFGDISMQPSKLIYIHILLAIYIYNFNILQAGGMLQT